MAERIIKHFAHSLPGRPIEEWHGLEEHLAATAELTEGFAHSYAQGWGRLAGLWHDLGKFQPEFQRRLQGEKIAVGA